ncbi:MAG: hypothetical protein LBQ22_13075 [Bacteroidales bacterium]|jgi:hypothetical protein|nr:hypothetical protein [Bacteroidales bacterium]
MTNTKLAILEKNNKTKYFIIGSLAIGTATFLGIKIFKIINWYNALKISITSKIHNYRNGNIILKCQVQIDNPKNFKITITKPAIRIFSGNKLIAKSSQSKEKITIQSNTVTTINYDIEIPLLSGELYKILLTAGVGITNYIKQLSEGTATNLNLGLNLTVKGYMQIYFMEKEFTNNITI